MRHVDWLLARAAGHGRVRGGTTRQQQALYPITGDHVADEQPKIQALHWHAVCIQCSIMQQKFARVNRVEHVVVHLLVLSSQPEAQNSQRKVRVEQACVLTYQVCGTKRLYVCNSLHTVRFVGVSDR
jgi:hypothetical protein